MSNQTDYTGKAPIYQKWDEKAFQFDTRHMPWLARSLYRVLLQNAWHLTTRPDLPDDDEQLRQIACGGDAKVWAKHGPAVRAMLTHDPDKKILWQKRLRQDWQILAAYRQKQKEHAEAQHAKHVAGVEGSAEQSNSKAKQSREKESKEEASAEPVASHQPAPGKPSSSSSCSFSPSSSSSVPSGKSSGEGNGADAGREQFSVKTAPEDCSRPSSGGGENQPQPQNQKHGQEKHGQEETSTPGADLLKGLQKIVAEVLKNTYVMHLDIRHDMEDRCELMIHAYGSEKVLEDFTAWCRELGDPKPAYPISDYAKIVDTRLGGAPERKSPDDPRIKTITSRAYELTGEFPPSDKSVASLLLDFSEEEITDALTEYAQMLMEKEMSGGMRKFFSDGGASAVILARRRKAEKEAEEEYCREAEEEYRREL